MNRLLKFLSLVFVFASGIYLLRRQLYARLLRLSPPRCAVRVERGVSLTVPDGTVLVADLYLPSASGKFPAVLMRTPYGRSGRYSSFGHLQAFFAQRFAERGYVMLLQDVRGRFDSGGEFNPFLAEREDGIATLEWMAKQPWCDGNIGMWGASYSGIVQWAAVPSTSLVKAFVPSISSAALHSILYPDGAFDLGLALRWLTIFRTIDHNCKRPAWWNLWFFLDVERRVKRALLHLPFTESDHAALGAEVAFFRFWLDHPDSGDDVWQTVLQQLRLEQVTAPAHLIGGWYDFFLRGLLDDYAALKATGQRPYLTIGPWHHFSALVSFADVREGLAWFDAHLRGETATLRRDPVRIYVMGADEWRSLPDWPPPAEVRPFYLNVRRQLTPSVPTERAASCRYTYDPARPTPMIGGNQFTLGAGARDNRRWERRRDVLTFTSAPLEHDTEVIGAVRLVLYVTSTATHTDFFGRLCDVAPNGKSTNVCDGLFRVTPGRGELQPDGTLKIEVDMWSTAYHFRRGHCIRLCISSGAHPRWNRNPGTDTVVRSPADLVRAEQCIFHDQQHPSALWLPVVQLQAYTAASEAVDALQLYT